jgi:hypothetical protein
MGSELTDEDSHISAEKQKYRDEDVHFEHKLFFSHLHHLLVRCLHLSVNGCIFVVDSSNDVSLSANVLISYSHCVHCTDASQFDTLQLLVL